jgi:hypothetical protein
MGVSFHYATPGGAAMGPATKEALAVSLCCFALSSCTTSVASTHRDPSLKTFRFQRAAVVIAFAHGYRIDEARRSGEDAYRRQLPSLNLEPTRIKMLAS